MMLDQCLVVISYFTVNSRLISFLYVSSYFLKPLKQPYCLETSGRAEVLLARPKGHAAQWKYKDRALSAHVIRRKSWTSNQIVPQPSLSFERRYQRSPWSTSRFGHHKVFDAVRRLSASQIRHSSSLRGIKNAPDCTITYPSWQLCWICSFILFGFETVSCE